MANKTGDCRATAALCLAAVAGGSSLSQQIPLFEQQLSERERPLFRQLCYGVLRAYPKLQAICQQLLSKPLKAKDSDILMLLMLGIYQLSETRVPDHAAVNATVAATRALKKPWAKGLANGILRQWQRRSTELLGKLDDAAQQAHPRWLYQAINAAWPERASAIFNANNQHPPMCLRVNSRHLTASEYAVKLREQGIDAESCQFAGQGLRLAQPLSVDQLPGFADGWVSVQDEAPQLSAGLLSLAAGQRVLDACCAPGGKSCHILESEPALEALIAVDIDQSRLARVQQNLDRLKLSATLLSGDAANPDGWWDGQAFDRILCDVPCSATGVIRRNPDIKLHRTAADISQLAALQLAIVKALWQTLKPGGQLLYATCSVLPEENEQLVASFCQQQADAQPIAIDAEWGIAGHFGRQLLPTINGHDGFYYALIGKLSSK
jgi:16S rRNA (cytosine967-C5)-methyltransferase